MALFGMILAGALLCFLGFWVEVRHRRHEQREENRRRHLFVHNHARMHAPNPESRPNASIAELDQAPEPATNGR